MVSLTDFLSSGVDLKQTKAAVKVKRDALQDID